MIKGRADTYTLVDQMSITDVLNQHTVESPTTLKGKGITELVPLLEVCGVKVDKFEGACKMSGPQSFESRHGLSTASVTITWMLSTVLPLCTGHSSDLYWEEYKMKLNISINGLTEKPSTLLLLFEICFLNNIMQPWTLEQLSPLVTLIAITDVGKVFCFWPWRIFSCVWSRKRFSDSLWEDCEKALSYVYGHMAIAPPADDCWD